MSTIPASIRESTYNPVGATGPWGVGFPIFDPTGADLVVSLNGVEQTFGAVWTITPGTPETGFFGAATTWPNAVINSTIPLTGELVIKGLRDPRRVAQFTEGAGVPARDQNAALNILTAVDQELRRDVDQEVAARISDVAALDGRMTAAELKNSEQDGRLDATDLHQTEQDNRLDGLDAEQIAQDARLDDHEARIIVHDQRLDWTDQELAEHELRFAMLSLLLPGVPIIPGMEFSPDQFGGDIQIAADAAWAANGTLRLRPAITYTFPTLDLKSGLNVRAAGAKLSRTGALAARASFITIGNDVTGDTLDFLFDGTETGNTPSATLIAAGDNFSCDTVKMTAASQIGYNKSLNGLVTTGRATRLPKLITRKVDYPLMFDNQSLTDLATGSIIGEINAEEYLRTFYGRFSSFRLGQVIARKRSPNADAIGALDGGRYISNLLEGCQDFDIDLLHMEECGHPFRVGGSAHANAVIQNGHIGTVFSTKTRGTAYKIAPSRQVSAGVTEKAYNIICDEVVAIDCGDGVGEGNRDIVRITHGRGCHVNKVSAYARDYAFSGQSGALLNDCDDCTVGLGGFYLQKSNNSAVVFSRTSDIISTGPAETHTFPGPVTSCHIGPITGEVTGSNLISFENDYGDCTIGLRDVKGFTSRLHASFGAPTLLGPTLIYGTVSGDVEGAILNPSTDVRFRIDVSWKGRRRVGTAGAGSFRYALSINGGTLDRGFAPVEGGFGTIAAAAFQTAGGLGSYGGSFAALRPGSNVRGAMFAAKQDGVNAANTGGYILTSGTGATLEETLVDHTGFKSNGDLEMFTQGRTPIVLGSDGNRYRLSVPAAPGPVSWVAA